MRSLLIMLMLASVLMLAGCEFWAETDYERNQRLAEEGTTETGGSTSSDDTGPVTPAFVENWFYREFGDSATFPDLVGVTDQDTVLAVVGWANGFTIEVTGDDYQYRTTGETVAADGGDSSSLAMLSFHCCRDNGIVNVSIELVAWDDGSEEYVCIWRNAGIVYILDGDTIVREKTFLASGGHLAYGFDDIDYWEYE